VDAGLPDIASVW